VRAVWVGGLAQQQPAAGALGQRVGDRGQEADLVPAELELAGLPVESQQPPGLTEFAAQRDHDLLVTAIGLDKGTPAGAAAGVTARCLVNGGDAAARVSDVGHLQHVVVAVLVR
jgi:hypothetical protein